MTYNLTAIYTGGPVDQFNGLTTQSNYVLLDGILIAVFIIILFVMAFRTTTKVGFFVSATVTALLSALISFVVSASGYPQAVLIEYSSRTLLWFAVAAIGLLWNVLSDT